MMTLAELRSAKLDKGKFYFVSPWGLGDTMMLCGLKKAMEQKLGGKICFIVKPSHEIVLKMYDFTDYMLVKIPGTRFPQTVPELTQGSPEVCDFPQKGNLFVAHPSYSVRSHHLLIEQVADTLHFISFYKKFLELPEETPYLAPSRIPAVSDEVRTEFHKFFPGKRIEDAVLIVPEANSIDGLPNVFWDYLVKKLIGKKIPVCTNIMKKTTPLYPGCWNFTGSMEQLVAFGYACKDVYALRSGICDLLCRKGERLHVYYPSRKGLAMFEINAMVENGKVDEQLFSDIALSYSGKPLVQWTLNASTANVSFQEKNKVKMLVNNTDDWRDLQETDLVRENKFLFKKLPACVRLIDGFADMESWGVWTDEKISSLLWWIPKNYTGKDLTLKLMVEAAIFHEPFFQKVLLSVNGKCLLQESIFKQHNNTLTVKIPGDIVVTDQLHIQIQMPYATISPHEADKKSLDARRLGIGFVSASLMCAQTAAVPKTEMSFDCQSSCINFISGFSVIEPWGVWSEGDNCSFLWQIPKEYTKKDLTLNFMMDAAIFHEPFSRKVLFFVNEKYMLQITLFNLHNNVVKVNIPGNIVDSDRLLIQLQIPGATVSPHDINKENPDTRNLGIALLRASVALAECGVRLTEQKKTAVPETEFDFGKLPACVNLLSGFSVPEPWGVWSQESTCSFLWQVPRKYINKDISLVLTLNAAVFNSAFQKVFFYVNRKQLHQDTFSKQKNNTVTIDIPGNIVNSDHLLIQMQIPEATISPHDVNAGGPEIRELGIGLVHASLTLKHSMPQIPVKKDKEKSEPTVPAAFNIERYEKKILNKLPSNAEGDMERPIVTVITVVRNAFSNGQRTYLQQCLDSVQQQIGVSTEHLIIDGASDDGTLEFIKAYQNANIPIRLLSAPDAGIYDAMNRGIELARGNYIIFLNADDYYCKSNGLAESVRYLEASACDFSYAPVQVLDRSGNQQMDHITCCPDINKIFTQMSFSHQSMMIRRGVMKSIHGFDLRYRSAADYDSVLRLIFTGRQACFVPFVFATFRLGGYSVIHEPEVFREVGMIYSELYGRYLNCRISPDEGTKIYVTKQWSNEPLRLQNAYLASAFSLDPMINDFDSKTMLPEKLFLFKHQLLMFKDSVRALRRSIRNILKSAVLLFTKLMPHVLFSLWNVLKSILILLVKYPLCLLNFSWRFLLFCFKYRPREAASWAWEKMTVHQKRMHISENYPLLLERYQEDFLQRGKKEETLFGLKNSSSRVFAKNCRFINGTGEKESGKNGMGRIFAELELAPDMIGQPLTAEFITGARISGELPERIFEAILNGHRLDSIQVDSILPKQYLLQIPASMTTSARMCFELVEERKNSVNQFDAGSGIQIIGITFIQISVIKQNNQTK